MCWWYCEHVNEQSSILELLLRQCADRPARSGGLHLSGIDEEGKARPVLCECRQLLVSLCVITLEGFQVLIDTV
jgi:hypothetical protein